ncbi:MAG: hypothetical protein R2939_16385 [Kofleriaceae bacterium]
MAGTARKRESSKSSNLSAKKPSTKAAAVTVARKSEPIIQMVGRATPLKDTPDVPKKAGQLPTPIASFVF